MNAEKEQQEFRALDFDEEDILFSSLVRFHYEMEAMEDLQKLQAGEFEQAPEEAARSQQRAEKFFRKAERMRRLRGMVPCFSENFCFSGYYHCFIYCCSHQNRPGQSGCHQLAGQFPSITAIFKIQPDFSANVICIVECFPDTILLSATRRRQKNKEQPSGRDTTGGRDFSRRLRQNLFPCRNFPCRPHVPGNAQNHCRSHDNPHWKGK